MPQNNSAEYLQTLRNRFARIFKTIPVNNIVCFEHPNGMVFSVCAFPGEEALVIEYAENIEDAELNRFEDGDRFYLEDMDMETMFICMIQEIGFEKGSTMPTE